MRESCQKEKEAKGNRSCKEKKKNLEANRGHKDIRLRERGTKKVHIFAGERVKVKKPKGAPAWMPNEIWKPKVKKIGVEKLDEI